MTEPLIPDQLEAAILALYRAPLDEFIGQRDALAKQLRAAKQRDSVRAWWNAGRVSDPSITVARAVFRP